jgi:hypothetical protein
VYAVRLEIKINIGAKGSELYILSVADDTTHAFLDKMVYAFPYLHAVVDPAHRLDVHPFQFGVRVRLVRVPDTVAISGRVIGVDKYNIGPRVRGTDCAAMELVCLAARL